MDPMDELAEKVETLLRALVGDDAVLPNSEDWSWSISDHGSVYLFGSGLNAEVRVQPDGGAEGRYPVDDRDEVALESVVEDALRALNVPFA